MTLSVQHTNRTADTPPALAVELRTLDDFRSNPRPLPSWSDEDAWSDPATVPAIVGFLPGEVWDGGWVPSGDHVNPEPTPADLADMYGTSDADELARLGALDVHIVAARRISDACNEVAA